MAGRFHRFTVGDYACTAVCDRERELVAGGGPQFMNADPDAVRAAADRWVAESGAQLRMSVNILVVDTDKNRVLVDTGNGPSDESARGGMLDGLAAAGIDPTTIDVVITTHGHGDHISGNTDGQGNPTFPNARYVISDVEWQRLSAEPNEAAQKHLQAIAGRYERVTPGDEIVPGITAVPAPGHAPGMMALLIGAGDERLLHVADAFHLPFQPAHPDWYVGFDADPEQTIRTRRELLDRAAREGYRVFAYHAAFPGLGRIESDGDVWRWRPEG